MLLLPHSIHLLCLFPGYSLHPSHIQPLGKPKGIPMAPRINYTAFSSPKPFGFSIPLLTSTLSKPTLGLAHKKPSLQFINYNPAGYQLL